MSANCVARRSGPPSPADVATALRYHALVASQRPPLCPYCGYDLSGTFERFPVRPFTCSECGESFMSDEADFGLRPGDWSLTIGMRRLAIQLAARTLMVAALEITFIWVMNGLVAWMMHVSGSAPVAGLFAFWPNLLFGAIVGAAMAYRLCDAVGIDSWWLAYAGSIAIVIGGVIARAVVHTLLVPTMVDPAPLTLYLTVLAIFTSLAWHYFANT